MLAWLQLPFCRCVNRTIETVCIHIAVTSGASISTKRDTEVRCSGWPFYTFLYSKPGSESVFSGSEIWPKYRAGFEKTQKFLDGIRDVASSRREARFASNFQWILAWDTLLGKKTVFRKEITEVRDEGLSQKGSGIQDQESAYKRTTASTSHTTFSVPR